MLESILGSRSCEYALIYIFARDGGYSREIAKFYEVDSSSIGRQLEKLEYNGVLRSKKYGKTLVYRFNPRYYFLSELKALLNKALKAYPDKEYEKLIMNR
jgi:hypothetical protein